ncbi:MAG: hypothetical protein IPJ32_21630 [Sphingobacteriaceae bacterium]|nr:hypothetical protein [Sphingobacteriaceae bacterium]
MPDASYMGLDVDNALLEKASKELPFADFKQIDITNKSTLPDKKFDLVLMKRSSWLLRNDGCLG